jgi:hypothetical protein
LLCVSWRQVEGPNKEIYNVDNYTISLSAEIRPVIHHWDIQPGKIGDLVQWVFSAQADWTLTHTSNIDRKESIRWRNTDRLTDKVITE